MFDENNRRNELESENLYFEDLENLREEQRSTHHTVLFPFNKNSVIDLHPSNNESFLSFNPKLNQLLRRMSSARFTVSQMTESFLNDPSRMKFKYYDYHGDIDEDGNKYIISRKKMKLTYGTNNEGQMTFKTDLVVYIL